MSEVKSASLCNHIMCSSKCISNQENLRHQRTVCILIISLPDLVNAETQQSINLGWKLRKKLTAQNYCGSIQNLFPQAISVHNELNHKLPLCRYKLAYFQV